MKNIKIKFIYITKKLLQSEGENEDKLKIFEKKERFKGFRTLISNRGYSQGITRIINIGTTTHEFRNEVITKKTTQTI